jgi:CBS domain containing-hemolysin-like protein
MFPKRGRSAVPVIATTQAANPFIWLLNASASALLRLFGARPPTGDAGQVGTRGRCGAAP